MKYFIKNGQSAGNEKKNDLFFIGSSETTRYAPIFFFQKKKWGEDIVQI
jgi:hypothetical protein